MNANQRRKHNRQSIRNTREILEFMVRCIDNYRDDKYTKDDIINQLVHACEQIRNLK